MGATTRYASRTELRQRIDPSGGQTWSATEDAIHDAMLDAMSRAIDDYCGQFFWKSAAASARVFTAEWPEVLVVPPLVSISSLKTDDLGAGSYSRTWASTDYLLWPENAGSEETPRPYYEVHVDRRTPSHGYVFPTCQRGVEITAVWGWPSVPDPVREVCLLEAQRLKELEKENARLKRIVADQALDVLILREANRGN